MHIRSIQHTQRVLLYSGCTLNWTLLCVEIGLIKKNKGHFIISEFSHTLRRVFFFLKALQLIDSECLDKMTSLSPSCQVALL